MEQYLQKQGITVNEVVYNAAVEQPIECDAMLPDYCPDIVKVLKCAFHTNIGSPQITADRLAIDGMVIAHVYYGDEAGGVRHAEYKVPFSRFVDLPLTPEAPIVSVTPRVEYVNCRAVNQRRLDVRGALSLRVKVTDRRREEIISDAQGAGLELRRDIVRVTELVNQCESAFSLQEELEISYGKESISNIIRTDYRVNVMDHKIVAGKIVAKGDLMLHVLYQPVGNELHLETMEYTLPISQIIDCDGLDESSICDVEMRLHSVDLQPKANETGEYRALMLDAKVGAYVLVHQNKDVPVASDCYSTMYESRCHSRPVTFIRLAQVMREVLMHKTTLELPQEVEQVMDVWCEAEQVDWKYKKGSLNIMLRLTVSMFARMESGECMYFERSSDLEQNIAVITGSDKVYFDPACDILSSAYNLSGKEKMDIRCEVLIKGCVYYGMQCDSIAEITVDEEAPKNKEQNKLYIYYAASGESVWDIAKRYNTSMDAICKENMLESDTLPGKSMLLIPMV